MQVEEQMKSIDMQMQDITGAFCVMDMSDTDSILDRLYDRYSRSLYRFAFAITGSSEDAEDAVQEVFIRLAREIRRLRGVESFKAYLFTSTRNAAYSILRKKKRKSELHQAMCSEFMSQMAGAGNDAHIDASLVCRAMADLPVEQREVLVLKVYDEMTFKEIADTTGIPINTAASRYKYAVAKLREILGVDEDE
jgi:RNA polymerase sigma-70 factor (ECF subfamily)